MLCWFHLRPSRIPMTKRLVVYEATNVVRAHHPRLSWPSVFMVICGGEDEWQRPMRDRVSPSLLLLPPLSLSLSLRSLFLVVIGIPEFVRGSWWLGGGGGSSWPVICITDDLRSTNYDRHFFTKIVKIVKMNQNSNSFSKFLGLTYYLASNLHNCCYYFFYSNIIYEFYFFLTLYNLYNKQKKVLFY